MPDLNLDIIIPCTGDLSGIAIRDVYKSASIGGVGSISAIAIRDRYSSALMSGSGGISATAFMDLYLSVTLEGEGSLSARVVETLDFQVTIVCKSFFRVYEEEAVPVKMFSNITKFSLWDLTVQAVRSQDIDTTQMVYEDVSRGQTERYTITAGKLVRDFLDTIDSAFSYNDPQISPVANLAFLQRKIAAGFLDAQGSEELEKTVRYIIEEMINAWRLKGTKGFIHWIIWTVFGWQLVEINSKDAIFYLNNPLSLTYFPGIARQKTKRILAPSYLSPGGEIEMVVDVFFDYQYVAKSELMEILKDEWFIPTTFIYVNTP